MAFVDFDPATSGTQHYGFGDAEFHVRLSAVEIGDTDSNGISGETVLTHEIIIQVGTADNNPSADLFFG
jgi:hypothetical protein